MVAFNNYIFFPNADIELYPARFIAKTLSIFYANNVIRGQALLSEKSFLLYLSSELYHVYFDTVSLAILQVIECEAEIITIIVDTRFRNNHIGTNLMKKIFDNLRNKQVKKIFLEVSSTNTPARKMYEKAGFKKCGIRKNYYTKNLAEPEDALIMTRSL